MDYPILINIVLILFLLVLFIFNLKSNPVHLTEGRTLPRFATLVYTDTKEKNVDSYMLKSEKHKLRGKPDLIYKSHLTGNYIPIELKSGKLHKDATFPREGDLMQLVAYFFMIEENYNCTVKYGKLIYKNKKFIVKNNRKMRKQFLSILDDMRNFDIKSCDFSPSKKTCQSCSLKNTVCEYKK